MKKTRVLGWVQCHPQEHMVRANVLTTVTEDDGTHLVTSGLDVMLEDPAVLAAAAVLEDAVMAATSSTRPEKLPLPEPEPEQDEVPE